MSESLIHLPKNPAWGEEYWIKGVKYQAIRGRPNKWSQVQPGISEVDKWAVANKFTGSPGAANKTMNGNTMSQSAKPSEPKELSGIEKQKRLYSDLRQRIAAGDNSAERELRSWGQPLIKPELPTTINTIKESAEWARLIHLVEFLKTK